MNRRCWLGIAFLLIFLTTHAGLATESAVHTHPAPPPLDLRLLSSRRDGGVTPPSGFAGKTMVRVEGAEAVLSYDGADGALEYRWTPGNGDSLLGRIGLRATMTGDTAAEVLLAAQAHLEWTADAVPASSHLAAADDGGRVALTRAYTVGGQSTTLTVTAALQGKSLVFDVVCDRTVVRALDGGGWGPVMRRRSIPMPYYSLPVMLLEEENLFADACLDWTVSQASSHAGTRAAYDALTDGTRNLLRERLIYTAAWHLDEILPNIPNAPSPFRAELARGVMLDIWGGSFATIRERLHALTDGGVGPGTAIIHDWQGGGYDNALPRHVPASEKLGGDPAMAALVQAAQRDGIRIALHENYVDYYPNAPEFAESDIARRPDGTRELAWLNTGTKIQSFAVKPARILPLAKTQGLEVWQRYASNACYLDVHSAVPPWFHVDFESGQPGAGGFRTVREAHRALWIYERGLHHGPVFGEGNNHWYWSGDLDGVEAQFGQGWPDGKGTSAPLLVDFDLLKIHPLQLNHGMGYYERWWARGPDAGHGLMKLLDQYRMQEAIYGHQGFLGGEAWHDPGLAWLESHLIPPLTERSALAQAVAIEYRVGENWLDTTAAVKAGAGWLQARVRYDNGLTVWANGGDRNETVDDATLPPNGWLARGAGLTAGTILRQGAIADLAETADSVFVNARPAVDWQQRGVHRIRPSVGEFAATGPRTFRVSYQWAVGEAVDDDWLCFVHFVSAKSDPAAESASFQQDHRLALPTSRWKNGDRIADGPWEVAVPEDAAPGDYLWTIGLHRQGAGRLGLQGLADAHRRVVLGTLRVAADGSTAFAAAAPAAGEEPEPVNREPRVLDFGDIRTDGSVYVRRDGADWVLRPFPGDRAFTVELRAERFGSLPSAEVTGGWWQLPLTGAKTYRWPAAKPGQ